MFTQNLLNFRYAVAPENIENNLHLKKNYHHSKRMEKIKKFMNIPKAHFLTRFNPFQPFNHFYQYLREMLTP